MTRTFDRCFLRLQVQPELLLDGVVKVRWGGGSVNWRSKHRPIVGKLRLVWGPLESQVVFSRDPGLIDDRTVENVGLQIAREIAYGYVFKDEPTQHIQ